MTGRPIVAVSKSRSLYLGSLVALGGTGPAGARGKCRHLDFCSATLSTRLGTFALTLQWSYPCDAVTAVNTNKQIPTLLSTEQFLIIITATTPPLLRVILSITKNTNQLQDHQ